MSSREIILQKIKTNKPAIPVATKTYDQEINISNETLTASFISKLEKSGAIVNFLKHDALESELEIYAAQENMVIHLPAFNYIEKKISLTSGINQLNQISCAILEAQIGVAENGAIWIDEDALPHRAVPFITQDLILILSGERLVANMHEAYKVVDIASAGYGLFIAGPSKTADIEQSLVIGAHGAKSLRVILV